MELKPNVFKLLNEQVQHEFDAAYLYLSMSAYFSDKNYLGFAHWMKMQAKEELEHAMKIFAYIIDRGSAVSLLPLAEPKHEWASPLEVFEGSLEHEKKVTKLINTIVEVAQDAKDHATFNFLQWFVNEQVEEEANVEQAVVNLKRAGTNDAALLFMDKQLGSRE